MTSRKSIKNWTIFFKKSMSINTSGSVVEFILALLLQQILNLTDNVFCKQKCQQDSVDLDYLCAAIHCSYYKIYNKK
jgi:hypothetical protein